MKHAIYSLLVLLLIGCSAQAQETDKLDTSSYFDEVEQPPEIIGGISELAKHVKYPEEAAQAGVQGMVIVKAYISEEGSADRVEVEKSDNELLNDSALKAVRQVKFKPGTDKGKAVKCVVHIPVKYRLN